MSDPSVDLEKGCITELKEEEKAVQFKHLTVMCLLDVLPVLYFVAVMFVALSLYRQLDIWWPALLFSAYAIFNSWISRRMKHGYIQHNALANADNNLSTTLLASSPMK